MEQSMDERGLLSGLIRLHILYHVAQAILVRYPSRQAHIRQHGQFDLGDVQPTAVLRRIVEFQFPRQPACLSGRKRLVLVWAARP